MAVKSILVRFGMLVGLFVLGGCAAVEVPPHLKPLPAELRATLAKKGMEDSAPIFIRIIKEESLLEVWKAKADGRFYHLKSYPVCKWSGALGPKLKQGDKQAPEGFYNVSSGAMNPHSKYHLSFNLGYPNILDKSRGRTGKHLMVHGDCKSAGCYAMTDALMEEIYFLARDAFIGGQDTIPVHAFPFRLTNANLRKHRKNEWYRFWKSMQEGYHHFEAHRTLPTVNVCNKRYLINASFTDPNVTVDPKGKCPAYKKVRPNMMTPQLRQLMAQGPKKPKTRNYTPIAAAVSAPAVTAPQVSAPKQVAAPVVLAPASAAGSTVYVNTPAASPAAVVAPAVPQTVSAQMQRQDRTLQTSVGAQEANAILFGDQVSVQQQAAPEQDAFEDLIAKKLRESQ